MKRFWDQATAEGGDAGWAVMLDKRPMRLPGGAHLRVASASLARALAEEWQAAGGTKGGEVTAAALPLTQLAGTAQERIAPDPAPTADALARYGESDLLCYRADTPPELVREQHAAWQPWLDWAAAEHGAALRVTTGIVHVAQDPAALRALHQAVSQLDAAALAALGVAVPALGSLVLGLALAAGRLHAAEAHDLATLDERWQERQWGEDAEALARRRNMAAELAAAERFLRLSRPRGDA